MRVTAVFLLGISTLGCKDKDAPAPTPAPTAPAPQKSQPPVATPEAPKLVEPAVDDPAWRKQMETDLPKVVPQLTEVKCEGKQCTAKLSAANDAELTELASKLEDDDALQAIGAKHVVYSRTPDDKPAMNVTVQF